MCTVTYLPAGPNRFFLTSNRDEQASRSPEYLSSSEMGGKRLVFPRDTAAGGTWIAMSSSNQLICILNGAYEKHEHTPPYRRSRGLMALDFFDYSSLKDFMSHFSFEGIEPFTMIVCENGELNEIRWDESTLHHHQLDPQGCYLWSSATLYDITARSKRQQWFLQWLQNNRHFASENIFQFHTSAGEGDPWNDVMMNRNGLVQTVSITQVVREENSMRMQYHDLIRNCVKLGKVELQLHTQPQFFTGS